MSAVALSIGRREFIYSAGYLLAAATLAGCQGGTNNAPQSNDSAQQAEREEQEEQNPTDRADGSGKARITFLFTTNLGRVSMGKSGRTNDGGWEQSYGREVLQNTYLDLLPDDLANVIVPVTKMTNNRGEGDPNNIGMVPATETEDSLWLLSAVEILGGFSAENSYTRTLKDE